MRQEMMTDIVNELFDYQPEHGDSKLWYKNCLEFLKRELNEYEGDWIPYDGYHAVPGNPRPVLVTYKWLDDDYEVSQAEFWDIRDHELDEEYGFGKHDKNVIAWKELPKPYKEDR